MTTAPDTTGLPRKVTRPFTVPVPEPQPAKASKTNTRLQRILSRMTLRLMGHFILVGDVSTSCRLGGNSRRTGSCPAFVVNPKIARQALEKQRADEIEYAQLLKDVVPTAQIYSGLDGGMNEVFLARFPGRIMLAKVMPYASYPPQLQPIPWVDNDGSWSPKLFGTSFRSIWASR